MAILYATTYRPDPLIPFNPSLIMLNQKLKQGSAVPLQIKGHPFKSDLFLPL